jgi:hypothetical protein
MRFDLWHRRLGWLRMVAVILGCGALAQSPAQAQTDEELIREKVGKTITNVRESALVAADEAAGAVNEVLLQWGLAPGDTGKYWLGVEVHEANSALRAQLGLEDKEGLVVGHVAPDGPAAKGGLKQYDVLIKANDGKLRRVPDLTGAVDKAEGKEVVLMLLRAGKSQTVTVVPDERPQDTFRFIAPSMGMVFGGTGPRPELPDGMKVTIERDGKKPASIQVKRGDEKWEITEDELDKLPDDVEKFVAPLVGGMPAIMRLEGKGPRIKFIQGHVRAPAAPPMGPKPMQPATPPRPFDIPVPPPGAEGGMPEAGPEISRRLDEIARQMEQMREEVRRLREERPRMPRPSRGAPPGEGEGPRD